MIFINAEMTIPLSELVYTFARSSGPGGQNVNKVNSKAVLKWNLMNTQALENDIKFRLIQKLQSRLNKEGELVISCDESRSQLQNRETCLERFREILVDASFVPKPRKKTKKPRSAERRERYNKQFQSHKKKMRTERFDD